jgi:hypothetical protein
VTIRVTIANLWRPARSTVQSSSPSAVAFSAHRAAGSKRFDFRSRQADTATLVDITKRLRRQHRLIDQTVYECSSCQERLLGERRCSSCNLWCRNIGIGGECGGCGEIVTVSELLGIELNGGDAAA